ncbi:PepSY domain-containing protein [Pedobacter sp. NJ-S-72]
MLFHGGNSISFDVISGQLTAINKLSEKSLWDKTEATFFSLHTGDFGGVFIKAAYVLIGLLPGLLSITGFLLWWRKRG